MTSAQLHARALLLAIARQLTSRRRLQLLVLSLLMLASGAAEVFSLAAVIPFLAVLTDPERLWVIPLVQQFALAVGLRDPQQLLVPATALFAFAAVLAATVRLFNVWLNGRLAAVVGLDLSCEAYRRTLLQPYSVHVQRNSSTVIAVITTQIDSTVQALNAVLQLATSLTVATGLLLTLLWFNWQVAIALAAVFGVAYALLLTKTRQRLSLNSAILSQAIRHRVKTLQEGMGAIRDVLLDGSYATFLRAYREADGPIRLKRSESAFLGDFPRYALEALGLVLIAGLALLLSQQQGESMAMVPLLGTLGLGAQRLLPALQQVYSNLSMLRSHLSGLAEVVMLLEQPAPDLLDASVLQPLAFQDRVEFLDVSFAYAPASPLALDAVSLQIRRGERVGIIGTTGSGKSTLMDLLMGLLEPSSGTIRVDGDDLWSRQRILSWRASLAHVPQSIYLSDSSVAENIAFGLPSDIIDLERVRQAAQQAQIAHFVDSLPQGYSTFVGERGVRLSGGQRQRIGIARALYKRAKVLVFDEATSALDHATEQAVMASINSLSRDLTIVMVAHRLSTIATCDTVFEISQGRLVRRMTGAEAVSRSRSLDRT